MWFSHFRWPWHSKYVMTSKRMELYVITSHTIKYVMTSKTCHDVKTLVITSKCPSWCQKYVKNTSWRQKVCCDIKGMLWHHKLCLDVNNFQSYLKCQIQFLFAFVLRIFCHQFYISTICRNRVINEYVLYIILVILTLTFDLFPLSFSTMQVSYPATTISSVVTIGPHLTNYSVIWTHRYTQIHTDR